MSAHVMMDLETLGTLPGCVVLSIGACTFNPLEEPSAPWVGQSYSCNIDRSSCEAAGLTVDPETLAWWERQSEAVRAELATDLYPLFVVAGDFHAWFRRVNGRYLWCNGAGFDEPIWRAAVDKVNNKVPWKYWNIRDTRTIWDVAGVDTRHVEREGAAHSAYADARHQAKCVQLAYKRLRAMMWPGRAEGPTLEFGEATRDLGAA